MITNLSKHTTKTTKYGGLPIFETASVLVVLKLSKLELPQNRKNGVIYENFRQGSLISYSGYALL